ncbi:MAG: hypothetical protein EOO82_03890, partial [Oxalobacteraceae bacterium]
MNIHSQKMPELATVPLADQRAPIRSDFLTTDELAAIGRKLAVQKAASLQNFGELRFPERLDSNEHALLSNHAGIAGAAHKKQTITPAAEWLLDHHHTIKENLRQVRRDLPTKFFRQLPTIPVNG